MAYNWSYFPTVKPSHRENAAKNGGGGRSGRTKKENKLKEICDRLKERKTK